MSDVEVSEHITADPKVVYDLISDLPRMGEWSPENTGGQWIDGATGPAVGARFRGTNHHRWLRWHTFCTVIAAEQGREFTFLVDYGPVPVSRWSYVFEPTSDGCTVTESWADRRPAWLKVGGAIAMAVPNRSEHNRKNMQATLATLKAAAESR